MGRRRVAAVGVLGALVSLHAGCGGGGGPSGTVVFEVGGEWIEISTLVSNTCPESVVGQVAQTVSTDTTIVPSGSQITFVFHDPAGDAVIVGAFNSRTGEFSLSFTLQNGGDSFVYTQSGSFSSNTRYTSETQAVITQGGQTCAIRRSEVGQRRA